MRLYLYGIITGALILVACNSLGFVIAVNVTDGDGYTRAQREQMEALSESLGE